MATWPFMRRKLPVPDTLSHTPLVPRGTLLTARDVVWSPFRGGQNLVDHASLELKGGEMVGLIGPNGAGKSSLIRLITGFYQARSGSVDLAGRPIGDWTARERARLVSYCAQDIPSEFPYSLRELVEMGRFAHESRHEAIPADPAELIDSIIEYVGLSALSDREFSRLSGGEKQLALFARALAQDGSIFVLDEPSSGLDMGTEHRLFSMLRELCREGKAVLAAIHNLNTAAEYCDRILLMNRGRIVAQGSPREVLLPRLVEEVYGMKVRVDTSDLTGAPLIQHCPPPAGQKGVRVHVIGGGGSAINLTRLLVRMGVSVSGGVTHAFDSDCRLWKNLAIPHVEVPPFSPIDDDSWAAALELVHQAELVVMTEFPFGPGNSRNIQLAMEGKRVILLEDRKAHERSFHDDALRRSFHDLQARAEAMDSEGLMAVISSLVAVAGKDGS